MERKRMISGVRCTVSNCEYWAENNRCQADQILVTHSSPMLDADKHGRDADELPETPADDNEETCCFTFEPAGSGQMRRAA